MTCLMGGASRGQWGDGKTVRVGEGPKESNPPAGKLSVKGSSQSGCTQSPVWSDPSQSAPPHFQALLDHSQAEPWTGFFWQPHRAN